MNTQKNNSSSNKAMDLIIVLIVVAFIAVGVWAVYPKIADNMLEKSIADGTAPQTVETYAKQAGLSVDEYLAQYNLTDKADGNTEMADLVNLMDVAAFAKFQGMEYADFLTQYGLTDKVTETTMWTDAQLLIPLGVYIGGNDYVEEFKTYYELDASVTADTPWGELKDIVAEKDAKMAEEMANATEAPAEGDATEAPAEGEATEAPAAE